MTDAEWDTSTDPQAMLEFLQGKPDGRELRFFACACVRRIWSSLTNEASRRAVEAAERFAEGPATAEELQIARQGAEEAANSQGRFLDWYWVHCQGGCRPIDLLTSRS